MTFEEILDQAVAMLQRRGRVTYRALKAQFQLDDDLLETLKEDLLYSQPQAVDDEGKGLIWTGETEPKPEPASTMPAQQEAIEPDQPTQPEPPLPKPPTPDAERRQLTVMFCDLADSTKLSGQLDPEDLRDVIRAYQETAASVIQRYEGYIAQYLGDGLLVYFGWPQAHEDDAQRGVHSGLGIIEAMHTLNSRLEQDKGVRLAVRIGIHTGLVVIGEMGGGGRHEQLALGETTNIAARLEGMAQPDTAVISEVTYRIVEGYFDCHELGLHTLKGVAEPQQVYRVIAASEARGRLDIVRARGLTPLVGRESEVTLLLERWQQVKDGQGQVVLLSGEGGIGKSRLVQVLKEHVADEPHTRWECRSSTYYQNTALYPVTDLFQRILEWQGDDTPDEKLEKLEQTLSQYRLPLEEAVPLFAPLLSLQVSEERYPPLAWSAQRQRQKTLESILAILLELAEQQPVLFILEDLHWTDPTTLEFLDLLIDQTPTSSIFIFLTCRPAFQPAWSSRSYLTQMTLNRLSRHQIEQMTERVTGGRSLPAGIVQQIVEKTDGVPLFVEEMTKAVLESGSLREIDGHYELIGPLASLSIPATLQDSLMARLDRLVTAKGVAQLGATIGRTFSYELLQTVASVDEGTLQRELRRLVEAELLYQRGLPPEATYMFKHALIQDAAYESLLRSTRQQYHAQVARVLESQFPETRKAQPELLAQHYTEAGLTEQAVSYWNQAGQNAAERSANVEAIAHLTKGLGLLHTLPATAECAQQELRLQIALGVPLQATKGYTAPDVEKAYTRARELCQQAGEAPQLFPVLHGLYRFHLVRAEHMKAHELGKQLLRLAQSVQEPSFLLEAHRAMGLTLLYLGEMPLARRHLEQTVALYNPSQHHSHAFLYAGDPSVLCRSFGAWGLWMLGYPDQALESVHQALTQAQELPHPFSLAWALNHAAIIYQHRRESQETQEWAEAAITLSNDQGFPYWLAWGTFLRGWALAEQGREEGIAQMCQSLSLYQTIGAEIYRTGFLTILSEAYGKVGRTEEGLTVLAEVLALVDKTGERLSEAELYRLKGKLLLLQSFNNQPEAESCFQQALDVARQQQAKSWELRAATSLARLWQQQGKRQEAHNLLAPVYGWFTEGFDTADLKDARALLDELA